MCPPRNTSGIGSPLLSRDVRYFVGEKTDVGSIQEEILADVPGYLSEASRPRFTGIVELVYDYAHKLRDPRKFIKGLSKVDGILDVIIVPGIGSSGTAATSSTTKALFDVTKC